MSLFIPLFIFIIISHSLIKKAPVYDSFLGGAKNGIMTLFNIFPAILAVTVGVSMIRASGALDFLMRFLLPPMSKLGIEKDAVLLCLVRPLSGSGALGILDSIFKAYSPDSFTGRFSSVLMCSSETTFYALSVYFSKTKVKYTKQIIPAAVFGDIVGVLMSFLVCKIFF